jgi:hypothetical protein
MTKKEILALHLGFSGEAAGENDEAITVGVTWLWFMASM